MKTLYKQIFPVVLGGVLWLTGNLLLVPGSARGSNPEAQPNPGCHTENIEFVGHQECGRPANNTCPGNWADGTYTISECNGADLDNSQYCDPTNPGPSDVILEVDQGQCDFFQGFCVQGAITSRLYSLERNQPHCSNANNVTP